MPKSFLNDVEINEALVAVRASFRAIQRIRQDFPGGRHVQLPGIPSIFSESIIAREIQRGQAPLWREPGRCLPGGGGGGRTGRGGGGEYKGQGKRNGEEELQDSGPHKERGAAL